MPWGKHACKKLAAGIASAPGMLQPAMSEMLGGLGSALAYLSGCLCLQHKGEAEEEHMKNIEIVLSRLGEAGLKASLRKPFFMQAGAEHLEYQLATDGAKPQPKKVEAMKRIEPPKNAKQLKRFLGMASFCRDARPSRPRSLAPLHALAAAGGKAPPSKKKAAWHWGKREQRAFDAAKEMLEEEAALAYPVDSGLSIRQPVTLPENGP